MHLTFTRSIPEWKKKWRVVKKCPPSLNKIDDMYLETKLRQFMKKLRVMVYGKKGFRKGYGFCWIAGFERGEQTGNEHIHLIIGNPYGLDFNKIVCRMCIKNLWEEMGVRTGMARVESFDYKKYETKKSIFYLCKHQIKGGNVVDFFPIPHGFNRSEYSGWFYHKEKREYIHFDELIKFLKDINPLGDGSLRGSALDWTNQVWCFGICKRAEQRIKATGMLGEKLAWGENRDNSLFFPQTPRA